MLKNANCLFGHLCHSIIFTSIRADHSLVMSNLRKSMNNKLIRFILMDYLIHIDAISMHMSVLYFSILRSHMLEIII